MSEQILQLNFKFNVTTGEYEELVSAMAESFAKVPGLVWKIWILNETQSEAGGIYLFDSEASLQSFLDGPLAAQVKSHPAISYMSAKQFSVMEDPTGVTRGPVSAGTRS